MAGVNDISAARGNLLNLKENMIHLYLSHKRFNGENKATNLTNFYAELNYSLELLMNTKEVVDFINQLLQQRNFEDLDRQIRLYLHTYFNCEFTITLRISGPNFIDEKTVLSG